MKKRYPLLCFLVFLAFACYQDCYAYGGGTGDEKKESKRRKVKKSRNGRNLVSINDLSASNQEKIKAYAERAKNCSRSNTSNCEPVARDCSDDYCGINECTQKIICCHTVDKDTFEAMIEGQSGYAVFPPWKFHNVADGAVCKKEMIRLGKVREGWWIFEDTYYRISKVDTSAAPDPEYDIQVHYSTPLIQGILKQHGDSIKNITVYTGVMFDDPKKTKIIPFKVTLKDDAGVFYYDVSDSQP